jgi:hypothetical protein
VGLIPPDNVFVSEDMLESNHSHSYLFYKKRPCGLQGLEYLPSPPSSSSFEWLVKTQVLGVTPRVFIQEPENAFLMFPDSGHTSK